MNRRFRIHSRCSAGNLHISLFGDFNGMCAWELFKTIRRRDAGSGRIFVNTAGLNRIMAEGAVLLKRHLTRKTMPLDWLYFKGEKGFQIAPDGSRVIICNRNGSRRRLRFKNLDNMTPVMGSQNRRLQHTEPDRRKK